MRDMRMRRNYFLMAAMAIALVVAGCVTEPAVEVVMDPDAPVTEAPPVYGVGSSWTYDHTVNGETVRGTTTIVEKREIDGREVDVHAKSPPNRDPGGACDGANGDMHDAVTHNWMGCLKDGEILGSLRALTGFNFPISLHRDNSLWFCSPVKRVANEHECI